MSNYTTVSRIAGSRQEMAAKYKSTCRACGQAVYVGDTIFYFPKTRKVEHYNCARRKGTTGR